MRPDISLQLQPALTGATLRLRPLKQEDFSGLYAVASDPLIVEEITTGNIIGSSRYYEWEPAKREIAIGYTFLARSHWGGTTNREMKQLMLEHIFQWADVIWFHVGSSNWRSRKAMEKIGGQLSHITPRELFGVMHEYAYYKIVNPAT